MNDGNPDPVTTLFHQALAAASSSRWVMAESTCRRILALHPGHLGTIYLLGVIYQNSGKNDLAITCYEQVLQQSCCNTDALNNLGTIHESVGNISGAVEYYRRAVQCDRSHFQANYNLGRTSRLAGDLQTAIASLTAALSADGESTPVLLELGLALKNSGNGSEALRYLLKAVKLQPDNPVIYNIIGNVYQFTGELTNAISSYRTAIQLKPDFAEAYNNLGSTYIARGDVYTAMAFYQEAVKLQPHWNGAASNALLAENYISSSQEYLYALHVRWGSSLKPDTRLEGMNTRISPTPKTRVGLISPDFRAHSVSWFLLSFLQHYDHDAFHVTCFSDTGCPDQITSKIRSLADDWENICGLASGEVVRLIRESDIDILIDLAGHTANNRLDVFAMRPAPVQVTYLGYPNTTGLGAIDYRITDFLADPPGDADRLHTEKLIRLPDCFLSYTPSAESPECSRGPVADNDYITFGSFNVLAKISEECVTAWSAILDRIKESRLVLKSAGLDDADTREFISERFRIYGIDPWRITMMPRTEGLNAHLLNYNRIDIALDTFPYNGTTTTCESLWMGVPVICLSGNRHAGRVGLSLLTQIGLKELIAESMDEYITNATRLAGNRHQLQAYRETLRERMTGSPVCDGWKFTRSLETAFSDML